MSMDDPQDSSRMIPDRTSPGDQSATPEVRDMRLDKVLASRAAIALGRYDTEAVLSETLRRLHQDLGL